MNKLLLTLCVPLVFALQLNAYIQDGKLIPNRLKIKNSSLFITFKVNGMQITPGTTKWFDTEPQGILTIQFENSPAVHVNYPARNPTGGILHEYYIDFDVTVGAFKKIYIGKEFETEKQIVERAIKAVTIYK